MRTVSKILQQNLAQAQATQEVLDEEGWDQWDNLVSSPGPENDEEEDEWNEWDQHIEEVDPDDFPDWDPDED